MSKKKQTPLTAWEFYKNSGTSNVYDVMEQYANQKVLEALEREVVEVATNLQYQTFIITSNPTTKGDLEHLKEQAYIRSKDYYETEVKPKYSKK